MIRILSCLSLVLLLAACEEEKAPPPKALAPPAVTVITTKLEPVSPVSSFSGRIQAVDKVDLRARVEGFLQKRAFVEGAEVKEGDILFLIERGSYESAVGEATARVARGQSSLNLANIELWRSRTLVQQKAVAQTRLDEAQGAYNAAKADVTAAEASLTKAKLDLSYTEIRAPISGRIGRATVSVGNFVGPSSGVLASLVSQHTMHVVFPVSQRELLQARAQAEQKGRDVSKITVRVSLADGQTYKHSGTINFVDVQVDAGTDTVVVRAELPNPERMLIDGQLVTALLETAEPENLAVIPQQAIQADQQGPFVLVVDAESKAQSRRIAMGQTLAGGRVAVRQGLAEGDRVITEGIQRVRLQQPVVPAEVGATPSAPPAKVGG